MSTDPEYGVAGSPSESTTRTPLAWSPASETGGPAWNGQNAHGVMLACSPPVNGNVADSVATICR